MKIVKKNEPWELEITCKNCETTLVIENNDIRYGDFYSGLDALQSWDYYVRCPVCDNFLFINKGKIPNFVKFQARTLYDKEGKNESNKKWFGPREVG